ITIDPNSALTPIESQRSAKNIGVAGSKSQKAATNCGPRKFWALETSSCPPRIINVPSPMPRTSSMHFTEAVAIATSSLWAHKLRSILTLIGVVIGVTSVIAVVSLINGANQYVATRVFRLGADVFGLSKQPSIITNVDDFLEFQKRKRITYGDFE